MPQTKLQKDVMCLLLIYTKNKMWKNDVVHVAVGAAAGAGVELGTFAVGTAVTLATGVFLPIVSIVGGAAALGGGGVGVAKYNAKKNEIMRQ